MSLIPLGDLPVGGTASWHSVEHCSCLYKVIERNDQDAWCMVINIKPCNRSGCHEKKGKTWVWGYMTPMIANTLHDALKRIEK